MKTLTIKNMPEDLHRELRRIAEGNHRSLNGEVLARLEASVANGGARNPAAILQEVAEFRARIGGPEWSIDDIEAAINEGRE